MPGATPAAPGTGCRSKPAASSTTRARPWPSCFSVADPLRVIFTLNATHALNIALAGLLRPGDHVVTSGMEHNAVMRPLRALCHAPDDSAASATWPRGIGLTVVRCAADGTLNLGDLERAVTPGTRLVVLNHASNVCGTILPVAEAAAIAHRAGALLLVDAAQTAGVLPIDVQAMGIDLLAFTGHKGLQGPPGTGGLVAWRGRRCGSNRAVHARRHREQVGVGGTAGGSA